MSKATKGFMSKAEIEKAIVSVATRGKNLDRDIQLAGLSILNHVQEHGEVSLAVKLLNALPKGSRRTALVQWFLMFGKISVNTDKATSKDFPLLFRKDGKTDLVGATETPWFDCKPEANIADVFNFQKSFDTLLNRLKHAAASGQKIEGDQAMIDAVLALGTRGVQAPSTEMDDTEQDQTAEV